MTYSLKFGKNKYGAVKSDYRGGQYDSKREARKAQELDMLHKAGMIDNWDAHVRIPLMANGVRVADYYVDFLIKHNGKIEEDGVLEYCEIKAKITMTPVFRLKWKILESMLKDDPKVKMTIEL